MKKKVYNVDRTVNLKNYNGELLYNNDEWGFIKVNGEINVDKFMNDWLLTDDLILDEDNSIYLIRVPACLTDKEFYIRHPEYTA